MKQISFRWLFFSLSLLQCCGVTTATLSCRLVVGAAFSPPYFLYVCACSEEASGNGDGWAPLALAHERTAGVEEGVGEMMWNCCSCSVGHKKKKKKRGTEGIGIICIVYISNRLHSLEIFQFHSLLPIETLQYDNVLGYYSLDSFLTVTVITVHVKAWCDFVCVCESLRIQYTPWPNSVNESMEPNGLDSRVCRLLSFGLQLDNKLGNHNSVDVNPPATKAAPFKVKHLLWQFFFFCSFWCKIVHNLLHISQVCFCLWLQSRTTCSQHNLLNSILTVVITKAKWKNRDANVQKETTTRAK